jgi:hypothetical protein
MVLCFFAALPVGLGFLVLGPVLAGSVYASYRDIFARRLKQLTTTCKH